MVDQRLAAALDEEFASDDYAGLTSVIVLSDGRTAYERYFGSEATDHQHVWSITKSIVSTLVGIAIGEGRIGGVEATLAQLLPDHAGVMAPAVAGITLEQLLTMTAGFADDLSSPGDAVASILTKRPPTPAPGSRMPTAAPSTSRSRPASKASPRPVTWGTATCGGPVASTATLPTPPTGASGRGSSSS